MLGLRGATMMEEIDHDTVRSMSDAELADKDADVIANFEKNVDTAAKQFGVRKQDLMKYFDKETLTILRR